MSNVVCLGMAWANNTINTAIFRCHGIFTRGRFQFSAFYVNPTCLRIVQRDLLSGSIFSFDLMGEYNLRDAHNSCSIGCDRDGYLHISYDHHATKLRYRRSLNPLSIHSWSDELPMSGKNEGVVTYPMFIMLTEGRALLMMYRDGLPSKGTLRIKEYVEVDKQWKDRDTAVLTGATQQPWTSSAYVNRPVTGPAGSIHLSFVWRTHSIGDEERVNNINIDYARSPDSGRTWFSSRNRKFKIPITQVNSETVFPVSPGSNLINQSGMAIDTRGHAHIVFYSNDPDEVPQYQHVWFDGREWRQHYISNRSKAFSLIGKGTLQIPISRPEIVIDDENRVYVIYRGDLTSNRLVAQRLMPPHYLPDSDDIKVLWEEDLGYSEPVIDHLRWQRDRVLSMLIQKNHQPAHDNLFQIDLIYEPINLVDWDLSSLWAGE